MKSAKQKKNFQKDHSLLEIKKHRIIFAKCLTFSLLFVFLLTFNSKTNAYQESKTETEKLVNSVEAGSLFSQNQKIIANDGGEGDWFGLSVAISGDTAVVGAYNATVGSILGQGAAYVYVLNGNQWNFQQKLTASDGAFNDIFGFNVAISDNTIVVGAPGDNIGTNGFDHGSAYIFQRNGSTWTEQQKILPNDPSSEKQFGGDVSIFGNTALVGARNDNNFRGAAYVFELDQGSWTQKQKLTASNGQPSDAFSVSMKIIENTAFIAAPNHGNGRGLVYVFNKVNDNWIEQQMISANDALDEDYFGTGLDFSNGTLVISASGDDTGPVSNQGSAYIFEKAGGSWSQIQKINVPEIIIYENFGVSISVSDNKIAVGANFANIENNNEQGAVYVFERKNSNWQFQEKITADDGTEFDNFGVSVAISGGKFISGAYTDVVGGNVNQGSAYIYNIQTSVPFDFDGDNKTDISIFRPAPGEWWYLRSSDGGNNAFQFGQSSDTIVPADFTGDGKSDIAFFRPSSGEWFILRSEDSSFYSFPFGTSGDIPIPADFDGDGKADSAVFRPSDSTWYIVNSGGGTTIQQFGANGDIPIPNDFDGDGKDDLAIFRPSVGEWYYERSSDQQVIGFQFGSATDKAVPADYTGDGKTDIGFWRPSSGEWFILRSEDNSFFAFPFGTNGDIPVPGDYDGDGTADAAIFRPSSNIWFLNQSTNGSAAVQFGIANDIPIPSAFIP